ncbi:MAG: DedA family protein [Alphaproteobacteria bacterium]
MEDIVRPVLAYIQANAFWAGPIVCLIAFGESLAFISLLVPATALLVGIGALVGNGMLNAWEIGIWAFVGATVGDAISYWFGRIFKDRIAKIWPFSKHPDMLVRGHAFFHKHGGKSVFIGRFLGPLRATVPIIAGMMDMPQLRFQIFNALSAAAWVPALMLPGAVIGKVLEEYDLFGYVWILFGGFVLFGCVGAWFAWRKARRQEVAAEKPPDNELR